MPAAVLVAEPEPIARTFLERHLIDNGFAVLATPDEGRPHLVLTGGLEAVDAWSGDVPVIVLGQEEAGVPWGPNRATQLLGRVVVRDLQPVEVCVAEPSAWSARSRDGGG